MAKNSIDTYGAEGKRNLLDFLPEALTLITDPHHPLYDERVHLPLDEAMIANIDTLGVLQPILVQKNPETGLIEVIVGRQRVKHTAEVNRRRIERGAPVLYVPGVARTYSRTSPNAVFDLTISENELRQGDSPMVKAAKMGRARDHGRDDDAIATLFGCTKETVRDTLALLTCTKAVTDAVDKGQIGVTNARKLAALPPAEQREKAKEMIDAGASAAKPRERQRAQRAIADAAAGVDKKPRMRPRAEIEKARDGASGSVREWLDWVLGVDPVAK